MPAKRPVAELSEQYLATSVRVKIQKLLFRVDHPSNPLLDCLPRFEEFFEVYPAIALAFSSPEDMPILKALSQGHQERLELLLLNEVVSIFVTCPSLAVVFGKLKCSLDRWLGCRYQLLPKDFTEAHIGLAQRYIAVSVDIER